MLMKGYEAVNSEGVFKTATMTGWHIYVCGPKLIEEVCKLPDSVLNIQAAAKQVSKFLIYALILLIRSCIIILEKTFQGDYTFSPSVFDNTYTIPIMRNGFTRSLPSIFPSILDELKVALGEFTTANCAGDDWSTVKAMDLSLHVIGRASNFSFVGLPLCRNKDYMNIMLKYTIDVMVGAHIIGLFPKLLKP